MDEILKIQEFLHEKYYDDYTGDEIPSVQPDDCCNCQDGCQNQCPCRQKTYEAAKKYNEALGNNPNWAKTWRRIHEKNMHGFRYGRLFIEEMEEKRKNFLDNVPSGIYECHEGCGCRKRGNCSNMVTQQGIRQHLSIKLTKKAGWSMFPRESIQRGKRLLVLHSLQNILGSFICLYLGKVLMESVNTMEVRNQINQAFMEHGNSNRPLSSKKWQEFHLNNKTVRN